MRAHSVVLRRTQGRAGDLRRAVARARTCVRPRGSAPLSVRVHDRSRLVDRRRGVSRAAHRRHRVERVRVPRAPPHAARDRAGHRLDRGPRSRGEPARRARRARRLRARVPLSRGARVVRGSRAGLARAPRQGHAHRLLRCLDRRLRAAGIRERSEARRVDPRARDREGEYRVARPLRRRRSPRARRCRARGPRDGLPPDQRAEGDVELREIVAARHREGDRLLRRSTRDRAPAREARPQALRADRQRAPRAVSRHRCARARAIAGRQEQDRRATRRAPRGDRPAVTSRSRALRSTISIRRSPSCSRSACRRRALRATWLLR